MKLAWAVILVLGLATFAMADEKADPKAPAGAPGASEGSYAGEVTASRLQLRAGPSVSYQPVALLSKGDLVVVLGKHPNAAEWLTVEVPQGYHAWVFGAFLAVAKDGTATVTTDRLLVRPRPTTRYHQLNGRLDKSDTVKVVGRQETKEGLWYKIIVPRRFPLYAHATHLKNVGPASLAEPKKGGKKPAAEAEDEPTDADAKYDGLERAVLIELTKAKTSAEIAPLRRAVWDVDPRKLSLVNRNRRVELLGKILKAEREASIRELTAREEVISNELESKLKEIEERYEERVRKLREASKPKKPRYVATGIVEHAPDIVGRYPSYRLELGGKMTYFLIARDYDLAKFAGKRVGVIGITDPESGTGYQTIMVKRIEILSGK